MPRALGIDLGTTNSCVAILEDDRATVIADRDGYKTTPSMVGITAAGKRVVGHRAKRQAITNAHHTVYATKRLIGRKWDSAETERAMQTVPYELVEGANADVRIQLQDKAYSIPEISSMILQEIRMVAEEHCGETIEQAVITVPAYFNDSQRQATKDAGQIAGIDVIRMINEPTAAALAYGYERAVDKLVAVYDLGGGTFDISILQIRQGQEFEVLSTAGDCYLGGEDFDQRLIDYLADDFMREHDVDLRNDVVAMQRLKDAAEKAKCELSTLQETQVQLPFIVTTEAGQALHVQVSVSRELFEMLCEDLIDHTLSICERTLEQADLQRHDIQDVLLVGGMTRMPLVQRKVEELFRRPPSRGVHPDEAVAIGAAIQADLLVNPRDEMVLLDVTSHALGIMGFGDEFMEVIPKNTAVPTTKTEVFTTSRDRQTVVKILVMQALGGDESDTELLGEFSLTGLRPAPKQEVQIEVTFSIDDDGIVAVSAVDIETGREQSIQVTSSSSLTDDEMDQMIAEAREYMVERRVSQEFEAEQQDLEKIINQIEWMFPRVEEMGTSTEFGPGAMAAAIRNAQEVLAKARAAMRRKDIDDLRRHSDAVRRTQKMFAGILSRPR